MKSSIRCSELDRILACPGSLTLCGIVSNRSGEEGAEGTQIHTKVAHRLSKELGATDQGFPAGFDYKPGKHITDWLVNFCFKAVQEHTPAGWSLETEIPLSEEFSRFTLTGHPDVVAINPEVTEFHLDDFKTGYAPVDVAEMNWQLLGYATLLKRAYPTLQKGTLRIIQPRNDEDEGHPRISSVEITNMDQAIDGLEAMINAALDMPSQLETGMSQCKWCSAATQCPALLELMKYILTPESLAKIKQEPEDAMLGDWVIAGRTLNRPLEDAEKMLHARLDSKPALVAGNGTQITRKVQRGAYTWPDPVAGFAAVKELLGSDEAVAKVATLSTTRIKDQLAEIMDIPKSGKAAVTAETVFDAKIRPLVEQGERRLLVFQ